MPTKPSSSSSSLSPSLSSSSLSPSSLSPSSTLTSDPIDRASSVPSSFPSIASTNTNVPISDSSSPFSSPSILSPSPTLSFVPSMSINGPDRNLCVVCTIPCLVDRTAWTSTAATKVYKKILFKLCYIRIFIVIIMTYYVAYHIMSYFIIR